jgi:hypothetical protein
MSRNGYFFPDESLQTEMPRPLLAKFMLDDVEKNLFKDACGVAIAFKKEEKIISSNEDLVVTKLDD